MYDTRKVTGCQYEFEVVEGPKDKSKAIEYPVCVVCRGKLAHVVMGATDSDLELVVCDQCGLGRCLPIPDQNFIHKLYPSEYYGTDNRKFHPVIEALVRTVSSWRARRLTTGLIPGAKVLDLGCGRGTMLGTFADFGLEIHGVEMSERAAKGADPRAEIRIADRLSNASYPSGFFDRVFVWHVLEHLADPRETLEEIHRILKPGGQLVVAVPNFSSAQARWAGPDWFHLDLPRHLFHFPLKALRFLIEDCGFRHLKTRHFSLRQNPFGWLQSELNRRSSLAKNSLYQLLQENDSSTQLSRKEIFFLKTAFIAGMPLALGLSVFFSLFRMGATVCVIAEKHPSSGSAEQGSQIQYRK